MQPDKIIVSVALVALIHVLQKYKLVEEYEHIYDKIMNNKQNKSGYILVLTLMIISAAMAIAMYIFNRGSVQVPFIRTMIDKKKAKLVALGGIQVAIAQLAYKETVEKKPTKSEGAAKPEPGKQAKQFLTRILPDINRWQIFDLDEDIDGVRGTLHVCLMCEEGKIDINEIYDFSKLKFKGEKQKTGDWKKILQDIFGRIEKQVKAKDLLSAFEKFLKARQYKINDVTELLTIKEFEVFKQAMYYEPPSQKKKKEVQRPMYLTDIFTSFSGKSKLEPWLFSDSIHGVFGLSRAQIGDSAQRKNAVDGWLKKFKQKVNWKQDWKTIMVPIYTKELQSLPKGIESIFSTTFDPKVFSVLSFATVGKVTQRLFAILERIQRSQNDQIVYDIKIRKLYWL